MRNLTKGVMFFIPLTVPKSINSLRVWAIEISAPKHISCNFIPIMLVANATNCQY